MAKRLWFRGVLALFLWSGGLWFAESPRRAWAESSVFGGALLRQGEVTLSGVAGFPDAFFQFNFANSSQFDLAFQARFNYNLGLPFFGGFAFIQAPMRIALTQERKLSMAIKLDPGVFLGGDGGVVPFLVGFQLGVGLLFTIPVAKRVQLHFGVELPMLLSFLPESRRQVVTFHLPVEMMVGAEIALNKQLSVFVAMNGGPYVYLGDLAGRVTIFSRDVFVSGSFRVLGGISWRR